MQLFLQVSEIKKTDGLLGSGCYVWVELEVGGQFCVFVFVYLCICIFVFVYLSIYMCVYVFGVLGFRSWAVWVELEVAGDQFCVFLFVYLCLCIFVFVFLRTFICV